MIDGGLRKLFRLHLPEAHWTSIETGGTGLGIPDSEYCFPGGRQGWVEFKQTSAIAVRVAPEQVAWAERRVRVGGRVALAVRCKTPASARRTVRDALFLYGGAQARAVLLNGLRTPPMGLWEGGPARWNWREIKDILI